MDYKDFVLAVAQSCAFFLDKVIANYPFSARSLENGGPLLRF